VTAGRRAQCGGGEALCSVVTLDVVGQVSLLAVAPGPTRKRALVLITVLLPASGMAA
jgi:hypothetical protein